MTTVKCQYTGIEFEAQSSRTKNHPQVTKFLETASKDRFHVGAYAKAKELLVAAKGQSDDISEIMTAVNAAFDAWCNGEAKATVRIVKQYSNVRRMQPGEWDELNDGIGGGQAGRQGFN